MSDYEVKADAIADVAFGGDGPDHGAEIATLRGEVAALSKRLVERGRPLLSEVKAAKAEGGFAERYLRKGLEPLVEVKRLSGSAGSEGGVAVPVEIDSAIEVALRAASPLRQIATVVRVGSANYRKLVAKGGFASGWVSQTGARPETATPDFVEVTPPVGELYANPAASQAMLDDAMFDVEGWLASEVAAEFARAEGIAFVNGTGINQPKGFLTGQTSADGDAARPWGTVQHVASGLAGNFAPGTGPDKLIDAVHALKPGYRQGACWVMNSNTLARLRKFKDGDGVFVWRPGIGEGVPATLLGYPVVEADAMPDVGPDSLSIAFGNFAAAYVIADRAETAVLRDPYSNKPFVHFYATRRVGGALVNSEAVKLIKFSVV
ncbi:phage major capsid protein [Sandaracinobacteroides saxicola]|uniref:Phage major capsid protein n=1 Tax=Sandaracinobacteroides saxicola TaxID=2759707 RepID=A0A7G5IJ37_9SPHN|nr:phage major capsid protein [Sandaracinobacteroides saxicola]QMW23379.1 phage major capsid protein [Sandaracinobacteroides saxicola]